jgi:hypothetical protein
MLRLRDLLDPDRDWRSWSTIEHFLVGLILCCLFDSALPTWGAVLATIWTGAVYEAGQTDIAYSLRDSSGRRYAGQPGYGFGLMDLAADVAGAITWVIVLSLFVRIFLP